MTTHTAVPKHDTIAFAGIMLKRYPRRTLLVLAAILLSGVLEGLGVASLLPLLAVAGGKNPAESFVGQAFSGMFDTAGFGISVPALLLFIIVVMGIKAIITYASTRVVSSTTTLIARDLRLNLCRSVLEARWSHFQSVSSGLMANAISTEAERAAQSYMKTSRLAAEMILVIVYTVLALFVSWKLSLAGYAAGFVLVLMMRGVVRMIKRAGESQTALMRNMSAGFTDMLQGFKAIKAMGREDHFSALIERQTRELNDVRRDQLVGAELFRIVREPVLAIFLAVGLYGALSFLQLPIESMLVFGLMFMRIAQKLTLVQAAYQYVIVDESAFWSIHNLTIEAQRKKEHFSGTRSPALNEEIVFAGVSFGYEGAKPLFENVSLAIPARKLTLILGSSGAGKTTLADMILGFYPPRAGTITVDGVPLPELNIHQWRRAAGYVPQDGFLLHDTIYNNVALGEDSISRADVEAALKAAGAWDFIRELPDGIDTVVGERGLRFSGGQRQRIAIARALALKPILLILDEATNALDETTETAILETLRSLAKDITIVMISHAARAASFADEVLTVQGGTVQKAGGDETPSRKTGFFKRKPA